MDSYCMLYCMLPGFQDSLSFGNFCIREHVFIFSFSAVKGCVDM